MASNTLPKEEVEAILKKRDELVALLEPFGLRLMGFDPGILADLNGRAIQFDWLEWEWLKPLIKELKYYRERRAIKLEQLREICSENPLPDPPEGPGVVWLKENESEPNETISSVGINPF